MTFWDFSWRGCVWWANIHFSSVVPIFNFLLSPNAFQINNVSKWKFYHSRPGSKWKWWPAVNIKHSRSPSWTGSRGDIWVRPNWCKSQHHRHRHRHHRPHHYHHRHRHPLHPVICHHCHPRHPFRSKPQVTHYRRTQPMIPNKKHIWHRILLTYDDLKKRPFLVIRQRMGPFDWSTNC